MEKNLAFDFGRNTTTLNEFIGYTDLSDSRQIIPKHYIPEVMTNESVSGNFDIWNIFPMTSMYATRLTYF